MPIDYSKWDNIEGCSSSDDEEEEASSSPRVTRLDSPSSITFGGSNQEDAIIQPSLKNEQVRMLPSPNNTRQKPSTSAKTQDIKQEWMDRGGSGQTKDGRQIYWSQDRYSVSLRLQLLPVDRESKIQSVVVQPILSYEDRHLAVGTSLPLLTVCVPGPKDPSADSSARNRQETVLLEGELPHGVHLAAGEEEIDWEVETVDERESRFLLITLYKAVPMSGMFIWWKRPMMMFDETDTALDRDTGSKTSSNDSAKEQFVAAWDEAHRQFHEKRKEKREVG